MASASEPSSSSAEAMGPSQPQRYLIMARPKRSSPSIGAAEKRASGLASIDAALDLGAGNSLAAFQAKIAATQKLLDDYNTKLGELDTFQNNLEAGEAALDQAT